MAMIERVRLYDDESKKPIKQLLFTRTQVARLLGDVSMTTIRALEDSGKLKGFRLTSRRGSVYYKKEDVDRLIAEASAEEAV